MDQLVMFVYAMLRFHFHDAPDFLVAQQIGEYVN